MSLELTEAVNISLKYLEDYSQDIAWKKNYLKAFADKDLNKGIEIIEAEISQAGETPILKLWWINAQLEHGKLPIAALSAPLDDLMTKINSKDVDFPLLISISAKIADSLISKKQFRLGSGISEKVLNLCEQLDSVSESSLIKIRGIIIKTLKEELAEAIKRKDSKSYIQKTEEQISKHEQHLEVLNKKKSVQETTITISESKIKNEALDIDKIKNLKDKKTTFFIFAITFFAITISVFMISNYFNKNNYVNINERLLISLAIPGTFSPILPGPSWSFPVHESEGSALDNLGERLNSITSKSNTEINITESSSLNAVDTNLLNSKIAEQALPQKTEELVAISSLPQPKNDIPEKKIPSIDPLKIPQAEIIGNNNKSLPIPQVDPNLRLSKSSEGRIYGPPQIDDQIDDLPSGRALDGSTMKPYTVDQFDPPLVYRVLTRTQVLSAPSLLAEPLAKLEPNTPVFVTAKMGLWLELRSTGGRVGYIYSQDAAPDSQPSNPK